MPVGYDPGTGFLGGNAYGSIPTLPPPVSTLPAATAGAISAGNTVNTQLPGYAGALSNIGGNISAETAGQLPPDVIQELQQQAAERGVATGSPGSPNSNAAYLKALGLNSLQLTQQGQQNFQSILPSLPGAQISQNPEFSPSSAAATDVNSSNAVYRSAPDPAAAARAAAAAAAAGSWRRQGQRARLYRRRSRSPTRAEILIEPRRLHRTQSWSPGGNDEYINGILQKYDPSANNFDYSTVNANANAPAGNQGSFSYGSVPDSMDFEMP